MNRSEAIANDDAFEEISNDERVSVLRLSGDLDLVGAEPLRRCVADAFRKGVQTVVLDLSRVRFIDSSGVRAILSARAAGETNGRRLRLVPGPRHVDRVFELLGVKDHLDWTTVERAEGAEPGA